MSTKNVTLTEAKLNLPRYLKNVEEFYDRFIITRKGKDKAILMSIEEYEGLLETLDILSNKIEVKAIKESKEQISRGEKISINKLEKEMGL